jgi:urate oxidase
MSLLGFSQEPVMLADAAYGKSQIRVVQVLRGGGRHALEDLTVGVRFEGDFDASYSAGDNSDVLPTDTMRNTVYAMASREPLREPEAFGLRLSRHFLDGNARLTRVRIDLTRHTWCRVAIGGRDHGHAFMRRGPDVRTATVQAGRDGIMVGAGVADLMILKTAGSAFTGFPRDEYTTLPETTDRLLATSLTATWHYADADCEFGSLWQLTRQTLLEVFAEHNSQSVQHTLHAMGEAVLERVAEISAIRLVMPNRHHLPVDLTPFGLENRNEIFVATEEPYGLIEATLTRPQGASGA